jgi:hypothetical protein
MSKEKIFADGMFPKEITTQYGAMTKVSFKVEAFKKFLDDNVNAEGWVNTDIKKSEAGKVYAELNTYVKPVESQVAEQPAEETSADDFDDEIPF